MPESSLYSSQRLFLTIDSSVCRAKNANQLTKSFQSAMIVANLKERSELNYDELCYL